MNMRIISAKDHGDSFRTLESGRAVAFMMDDALLAGERAKAKKPDNWEIVGFPAVEGSLWLHAAEGRSDVQGAG